MRWLLALMVLSGCAGAPRPRAAPPSVERPVVVEAPPERAPIHVRLATFNLQVFGPAKASRPEWLAAIAAIIRGYDVVAVQEIRDVSEQAPRRLLDAINALDGPRYDVRLSPRTGQQPDDRRSQEQYAYYFRTDRLEMPRDAVLFDDSAHDYFQREPYLGRVRVIGGGSFVLMNIHTPPRVAVQEIAAMEHVFRWARARFADEDVFIALGDFNAGCGYASEDDLDALPIHGDAYDWVVPHSADTNVADSECPYDRVVVSAPNGNLVVDDWGVHRAFEASEPLSDHYPVWVDLVF